MGLTDLVDDGEDDSPEEITEDEDDSVGGFLEDYSDDGEFLGEQEDEKEEEEEEDESSGPRFERVDVTDDIELYPKGKVWWCPCGFGSGTKKGLMHLICAGCKEYQMVDEEAMERKDQTPLKPVKDSDGNIVEWKDPSGKKQDEDDAQNVGLDEWM